MRDRTLSTFRGLLAAPLIATLTACVPISVEPIVTEANAMLDQRLLGTWVGGEEADTGVAVISRASETLYAIEYTEDGEVIRLRARLGSLGGRTVLDVWPTLDELSEPYSELLIVGHLLLVVDIDADALRMATLERNPLLAALRSQRVRLRLGYRDEDERTVLFGSTEELRAALGPHLATTGALDEAVVLRRSVTAAPTRP